MGGPLKPWSYRLIGILVSVFFVYLAVRRVDVSESLRVLGTARPLFLGAAVLVYLSGLPVRTLRWRLILRAQRKLSWREVLVPLIVGHMANNVLPARTGEVYRAHFLGRRVQMSRSGVVGSIVVERAFDGLMLVCVMLFVLVSFPGEHLLGGAALATAVVFLGLAGSIILYGLAAESTHRGIERALLLLPRMLQQLVRVRLDAFLSAIRGFLKTGGFVRIILYTALIWLIEAGAIALVVLAFDVTLPLGGYLLVFALAALSTTLPSGPGYIGPYQYAFIVALGVFAVSREAALAISIAAQASLLGSVTVIGIALLWRENLSLGEMARKAREEQTKVGEKAG